MRRLGGFGMASRADQFAYQPDTLQEAADVLGLARESGRQVVLRGTGLSYGDANIGSEAISLSIAGLDQVLSWDPASGLIDCQAGVTIEQLWRTCLPDGWWPPVVSGTMFPTLGGALGMNIHGKNNTAAGTLGEHVVELDVLFADGTTRTLAPADDLFRCVISSAGLLGAITRVKLQMKKVSSGLLKVYAYSAANLQEQMDLLQRDHHYRVGWVDCFSTEGRGEVHLADYTDGPAESFQPESQDLPGKIMGLFPKSEVWRILRHLTNPKGMKVVNTAKFAGSKKAHGKTYDQPLVAFNFLLDYVPNWRKAYLPGGFIQYQSFVPKDRAHEVFSKQLKMQHEVGLVSFLGVLKRHRPDNFMFSHAVDGYSLALDFRVYDWQKLRDLCHRMNDLVLDAGGRFYFAKDSTLRPQDLRYLGDSLPTYLRLKAELDPDGIFTSGLARRLELA